jgi:hypothetical protein
VANWHVIENTGLTLVALIERRLAREGIANVTVSLVTTAAFTILAATPGPVISLFLYQVSGNSELRNLPAPPPLSDGRQRRQPLPLELNYLVTAWGVRSSNDVAGDAVAAQEEARLMGLVLQAFYDNAELGRSKLAEAAGTPVWAPEDGLQIVMQTLPIDAHYRIWDAAELGYRLSLVYRVRVASLEATPEPAGPPVTDASLEAA